ncbi:MAG: BatD family protein, partial [Chromatiales bacterium]|nr:BatD family protein [Chromatiales bacterium]
MVKTLWLLLLAVAALPVWAAPSGIHDFSAEVDRRELYVNEHVVLTLSLTGSDTRLRAEGVSPNIDLTVLAGAFELGTPKADFRFNIDNNRGRATSSITVELFPRTAGRLRIPAFTVDGLNTQAIELRVSPLTTDTSPEAFVRSGVASKHLFTGEQALVYLDLYHRVELASARMGGALDSKPRDIAVHTLPASERTERVDGIEYQVTRTAWAASMMQAGEMTLLLPDIWVETRQGRRWRLPFREERIEVRAL